MEGQKMNERIQELMLEAGKTIPGDKHIDADFCKKFAELILRECIICAEREWIRHGSDSVHNKAIHKVIESIKEHFGVEE